MIDTLQEAVERALAAEKALERAEQRYRTLQSVTDKKRIRIRQLEARAQNLWDALELSQAQVRKAEAVVEAAREFCGPMYSQGSLARLKAALAALDAERTTNEM